MSSALSFRLTALVVAPLSAAVLGADAHEQITDRLDELPGATVLFITGFLGHVICLVVQPFGSGLLILAACTVALAYALWQLDWRPREPLPL